MQRSRRRQRQHRALAESALGGRGDTDRDLRQRIFDGVGRLTLGERDGVATFPTALRSYLEILTARAAETTEAQVASVRDAGYSDDALYEITVVGSVAAGITRLERALSLLEEDQDETGPG